MLNWLWRYIANKTNQFSDEEVRRLRQLIGGPDFGFYKWDAAKIPPAIPSQGEGGRTVYGNLLPREGKI